MNEAARNFFTEMERYLEVYSLPDEEYQIDILSFHVDVEGVTKLTYQITKYWTVYNVDDNSTYEQGMIFTFWKDISPR